MALMVGNAGMALPMGGAVTSTVDSRPAALAKGLAGDHGGGMSMSASARHAQAARSSADSSLSGAGVGFEF